MKRYVIFLAVVVLISLAEFFASAFDDGDWQIWIGESATKSLDESWALKVSEEQRYGDSAHKFYRHHLDLGLIKKISKKLKVSFHFRYISEKKRGEYLEEYRPYVNLSYKWKLAGLNLTSKVQVEFRDQEHNDFYRFRKKLTLSLPKVGDSIRPYISDEIFIDSEQESINRNRLTIGSKIRINKKWSCKVFYIWQSDKKTRHWKDTNILGLQIGFKF